MQKCKTLKKLLAVSAVAAMFSTVGVHAQTPAAAAQNASSVKISSGDEKALKDMAQADINEVAAAKIAQSKAQSSEVQAFAQQMAEDHGNALMKVQITARQKGVALPTQPDAMHMAMAAKLEKQSGGEFDKLYMENAGTKDHKMVLALLQSDAKKINDPDVKALADAHTPVVEKHLKSAQQMAMQTDMSAGK
ncbi:DUF4142 domain-containing protein [Rahnella sp. NRRL B-41462]|uniref:DUF4142 domain-containing protein n=1 Tax=Rahnella sp. NRRL B-41462 TaxID=1610579 RepID=UPI000DD30317|nr:DUF4142 domain-containing protein [Rahnella sp. NRRL B-41462]CAH0132017.1 hypothetical protein SRABI106_00013 [Rahnella aquatilis]